MNSLIFNYNEFRVKYSLYNDSTILRIFNVITYLTIQKKWSIASLIECSLLNTYIIQSINPREQSANSYKNQSYTYEYIHVTDSSTHITDTLFDTISHCIQQYTHVQQPINSLLLAIVDSHSLMTYLRIYSSLYTIHSLSSYYKQVGRSDGGDDNSDVEIVLNNEYNNDNEELITKHKSIFQQLKQKKQKL